MGRGLLDPDDPRVVAGMHRAATTALHQPQQADRARHRRDVDHYLRLTASLMALGTLGGFLLGLALMWVLVAL